MAPVEGYHRTPEIENSHKESIRIPRGSYKRVSFPSPDNPLADVFVHCDAVDTLGVVNVITQREDIAIVFFDGRVEDDEGLYLGNENAIKFSGAESVEIVQMGNPNVGLKLSHFKMLEDDNNIGVFQFEKTIDKIQELVPEQPVALRAQK